MWLLHNLKAYPTSESLLSISARPSSRRNRAIASRFSSAKTYRVLLPSASLMFTSAPWLSRLCTTSQCPSIAASLWRTKWLLCYILHDNKCTIIFSVLPACPSHPPLSLKTYNVRWYLVLPSAPICAFLFQMLPQYPVCKLFQLCFEGEHSWNCLIHFG